MKPIPLPSLPPTLFMYSLGRMFQRHVWLVVDVYHTQEYPVVRPCGTHDYQVGTPLIHTYVHTYNHTYIRYVHVTSISQNERSKQLMHMHYSTFTFLQDFFQAFFPSS